MNCEYPTGADSFACFPEVQELEEALLRTQQELLQAERQLFSEHASRAAQKKSGEAHWLWVKHAYPKWNPCKWNQRLKPAVSWWFYLTHAQLKVGCIFKGKPGTFNSCGGFDVLAEAKRNSINHLGWETRQRD